MVPIRRKQGAIAAYSAADRLVTLDGGKLRCTKGTHGSHCRHVAAVENHLRGTAGTAYSAGAVSKADTGEEEIEEERDLNKYFGGDECIMTGVCCGLPQIRGRAVCDADLRNEKAEPGCRHEFDGGGQRTGGVVTVFCPHGICYLISIIEKIEGRDELYSFLTCYLQVASRVIIYDFACALHEYCLNRLPDFFRYTLFIIDRLHWKNHKNCALS